jgi:hypothetical protein
MLLDDDDDDDDGTDRPYCHSHVYCPCYYDTMTLQNSMMTMIVLLSLEVAEEQSSWLGYGTSS